VHNRALPVHLRLREMCIQMIDAVLTSASSIAGLTVALMCPNIIIAVKNAMPKATETWPSPKPMALCAQEHFVSNDAIANSDDHHHR
jgi:hypothetical protein